MAKRRRQRTIDRSTPLPEGTPAVGPREPCPCGSGERYKNCHGRQERAQVGVPVPRPYAGVPFERDLVALREFVPSATATLPLAAGNPTGLTAVRLCSLLPMAWPALRRPDGEVWGGLQLQQPLSLDPSRDFVAAVIAASQADPGTPIEAPPAWSDDQPALADLVAPGLSSLDITVHEGFSWWLEGVDEDAELAASMERANEVAHPTAKLAGVEAVYWCQIAEKYHVRWVTDHPEDRLLDGLARLQDAGEAGIGDGTRLVGMFRTFGLVVPVWDLPAGCQPDEVEEPMAALVARLDAAMAETADLTSGQRRARSLLGSRQVTLR